MATMDGMEVCSNSSNGNGTTLDYQLANLHIRISGSLGYFLILPFLLFYFQFFPIGLTTAVLLGAMLMVTTLVVDKEEAYAVMTKRNM